MIEIDQTAPVLDYVPKIEAIEAGKPLEISVHATDNVKVAKVTLFYRRNGDRQFLAVEMVNTDHDNYSCIIPGTQIFGKKLDYYIVAEDGAGNRTMKGFSGNPMSLTISPSDAIPQKGYSESISSSPVSFSHPDPLNHFFSNNSTRFLIGGEIFSFSEQGNQATFPALAYGVEWEYRYRKNTAFDLGIIQSQTEGIEVNPVTFQNLTGTLFESLNSTCIYAGQRYFYTNMSFLVALNYIYARLSDRNLLNAAGYRITEYPDDNLHSAGVTFGYDFDYPVSEHFGIGFEPKINLFFSGQLNHVVLPGAIHYEF